MENRENIDLIILRIKSNKIELINTDIIVMLNNIFLNTGYDVTDEMAIDDDTIYFYIRDTSYLSIIESTLDKHMNLMNFKYGITLYQKNKKYPLTIRFNKNRKKIITKSQTKLLLS